MIASSGPMEAPPKRTRESACKTVGSPQGRSEAEEARSDLTRRPPRWSPHPRHALSELDLGWHVVRRGPNRFVSVMAPPGAAPPTETRPALAPPPPSRPGPACARPAAGSGDTTAAGPCPPARPLALAARSVAGRGAG